jgi:membrane-bound metal-dependent hydrolase YbcI (DUF457 family)
MAANGAMILCFSTDPVLAAVTIACARLPDQAEKFLPGVRHRTVTHHLYFWVSMTAFSLLFPWKNTFPEAEPWIFSMLVGIFLGGALHVIMDMFSKSGIPLFPGKVWGAKVYTTGSYSEYLFLGGIILLCGGAFFLRYPQYFEPLRAYLGF